MTRLLVVRGDITTIAVDVIVNAANSGLIGGGGVDGAIHRAGGPVILEECRTIVERRGGCVAGDAVATGGGALAARRIIHTVGPIWRGVDPEGDDHTLASCYRTSLDLAAAEGLRTIAFPNVSTGVYGFPKDRAAGVAVDAVRTWVEDHPGVVDSVTFVCFDDENEHLYRELLGPAASTGSIPTRWHDRVAAARSGTLATVTGEGRPHAVPCCFVIAGGTVYSPVDAKPKTTLALKRIDNIRAEPAATLLVDHYANDWSTLWWIRLDATARVLDAGPERESALDALAAKYHQYRAARPPGAVIALDVDRWRSWEPASG